jgi:hypothetical protein
MKAHANTENSFRIFPNLLRRAAELAPRYEAVSKQTDNFIRRRSQKEAKSPCECRRLNLQFGIRFA